MPFPIADPTRVLFFTGKGGVGKTSSACATAISLADAGKRVLLVSTDPASNLDEMLEVELNTEPRPVPSVPRLMALNIDPEEAARVYREKVVGPYRGILPVAAVKSMEEQLSGACTTEIAAFDEFSKLLGDGDSTKDYDHLIFDTAPTGHTLRLLELPAAWTGFIETSVGGTSCLGPLAGLSAQKALYAATNVALRDARTTTLLLVARPDRASITEAERTREELSRLGITNLRLVINGIFVAGDASDPIAIAMERRGAKSLENLPAGLGSLCRIEIPLLPFGLVGIEPLRMFGTRLTAGASFPVPTAPFAEMEDLDSLIEEFAKKGRGVIMTMGKGGEGKTTVADAIAMKIAGTGRQVTLTTTDPAAHVAGAVGNRPSSLRITRIDPAAETRRYRSEVLAEAGKGLDAKGLALLEEDLRSPCTEEIAVFRAFAETVAQGEDCIVVIDTAPTGHTLLLLDAAESYHREVLRKPSGSPEAVQRLTPRLRDPDFTHILLVTVPEATPIHEAMQLERDLARADIRPLAWIVNQSLTPLSLSDPILQSRKALETGYLEELSAHATRIVLMPWKAETD